MQKIEFIFCFCLLFFFSTAATAEFYNYIDESGIPHYTDDYSKIPDKFKDQVKINKEFKPDNNENFVKEKKKPEENKSDTAISLIKESEILKKERKNLNTEYNEILKKEKELKDLRASITSKDLADQYKSEIEALQKKMEIYEKNRSLFNERLKIYNDKVAELNKN